MRVEDYRYGMSTPYAVYNAQPGLTQAFADECEATVQRVMALGNWGLLRVGVIADLHSVPPLDNDRRQLLLSSAYLAKKLGLDAIILPGDILNGTDPDAAAQVALLTEILEIYRDTGVLILCSRGNHDDNSVLDTTTNKPDPDNVVLNQPWNWLTTVGGGLGAAHFIVPSGSNGYWLVDLVDKKIRFVVIDTSDLTDAERLETGGQNYHVVSAAQLKWLDEEALVVPDGWRIICTGHVTPVAGMPHNLGISNRAELYAVLEAHAANIIAYICGHGHMDADFLDPATGIHFIMSATAGGPTVSAANAPAGFGYTSISDEAKAAHPCGKYGFGVLVIHADGTVDMVRFGPQPDVVRDVEEAE